VMMNLEKRLGSRVGHFLKTLFALPRCMIIENNDAGDLLSHSQMHVNEWDEVALTVQ
jgi:hypothetical protein